MTEFPQINTLKNNTVKIGKDISRGGTRTKDKAQPQTTSLPQNTSLPQTTNLPKTTNFPQAFSSTKDWRHYQGLLTLLVAVALISSYGLLVYNNPVASDSPSFWPVVDRRLQALIAMMIAAVCQGLATLAFQSLTQNRLLTPSLLGFEALYSSLQSALLYFGGMQIWIRFSGSQAFLLQTGLMVVLSLLVFGKLLTAGHHMSYVLLVGIVLGTGLRSVSTFMRRLLNPAEFDSLQARLYGSVNNADAESFPIAISIVCVAGLLLLVYSKRLNCLALGRAVALNLGLHYQKNVLAVLALVSILMSVSTALLGPITFLGFLASTLTYQLVNSYDHRYLFPVVILMSYAILTSAYFLMYHVFNAQGVVTLIIEFAGGLTFLCTLLRRRC